MRRYIIASHHLLAHGLKDTLNFLTSMDGIIDISAYMDDTDLPTHIKELFDSFDPEDEVVMMTDMLGGSVNQQFCPYVNDHRHLICGINLPCALSLVLQPQDMPLTAETIRTIVEESRSHLIYVNEYNDGANDTGNKRKSDFVIKALKSSYTGNDKDKEIFFNGLFSNGARSKVYKEDLEKAGIYKVRSVKNAN